MMSPLMMRFMRIMGEWGLFTVEFLTARFMNGMLGIEGFRVRVQGFLIGIVWFLTALVRRPFMRVLAVVGVCVVKAFPMAVEERAVMVGSVMVNLTLC